MNVILEMMMITSIVFFCLNCKVLKEKQNVFSRPTTNSMKGLAMIGIILHHIRNSLGASSFLLGVAGYIGTGIFFFISGYGNELSIVKSGNVTAKWIGKKIKKLYLPFIVCYVLWIAYKLLLRKQLFALKEILGDVLTMSLPNMINWFPKVILLCFILHWICVKCIKKVKVRSVVVFVIVSVYVVVLKFSHVPNYWYLSVMCYPLGILFANRRLFMTHNVLDEKCLNSEIKNLILCVGGITVNIILLFLSSKSNIICIVVSMSFSIFCFVYSSIFEVRTKFLSWIGVNSFECYLFHLMIIQVLSGLIEISSSVFILMVLLTTFLLVFIYDKVMTGIIHSRNKRKV